MVVISIKKMKTKNRVVVSIRTMKIEVFKNIKYIVVTSRASKLQVFKVEDLWDLNPGLPPESLNIGKLTHVGGLGSNPCQAKL